MNKSGKVLELTDLGTPEARSHGEYVFEERSAAQGKALRARKLGHLEILERNGTIEPRHRAAGEQFGHHLHHSGLGERYATINLFRVMGGAGGNPGETAAHHYRQVRRALEALGGLQGSVVWDVCGGGRTINAWARSRVAPLDRKVALGILIAALDRLASVYGH